ncbi:MAG: AtpZ/AtpI family protein [Ktedonobacteraceae bacterium]|nr:AtpZ/AtpI family protein [Ktedonobacteraceae bacterium]
MMKEKPPLPSLWGTLGAFGGMGFTLAIPIIFFTIVGYNLDGYTHTRPLFTLLGLLLGLISGIYGAYRLLKSVLK